MGKIIKNGLPFSGTVDEARFTKYDNSNSGLVADNVQAAIDEVLCTGKTGTIYNTALGNSIHITDATEAGYQQFIMYGKSIKTGTASINNPVDIISSGEDGNVSIFIHKKNCMRMTGTTTTIDGVQFTVNPDKSVTVNGTINTDVTEVKFVVNDCPADTVKELYGKEVILSGCPEGGSESTYFLQGSNTKTNGTETVADLGEGVSYIFGGTVESNFSIIIKAGYTANNIRFYPMVRLAEDVDPSYEPYEGVNVSIPTNGDLHGIPVESNGNYVDIDGKQYVSDIIDKGRGRFTSAVNNLVFTGNENWENWTVESTNTSGKNRFRCDLVSEYYTWNDNQDTSVAIPTLCNYFNPVSSDDTLNNIEGIAINNGYSVYVYAESLSGYTVDQFKSWLNDHHIRLYYPLAVPVTMDLEDNQVDALKELKSFGPITNISSDDICDIKVEYFRNTPVGYSIGAIQTNIDTMAASSNDKELTKAEYDALSEEEKHNGTVYYVIDDNTGGGGGSCSGDHGVELTYEEYQALSEEEKKNGTTYYVSDAKITNVSTILNTKEEIESNTEENKIAGALAVKELSAYVQKNMAYKDISDKFTADASKIKIMGAYVENGMVFINVRVLAGVNGTVSAKLNDLTYAPRVIVAGVYMSMTSIADKGKFVGGNVSKEGVLTLWFDSALSYEENVVFTYPLKIES